MARYEFCSDEYLAEAARILSQLVQERANELGDERFSCCEIYFDPPPHLRVNGTNSVWWSLLVGANQAVVSREIRDDVDLKVTTDYSAVVSRARTLYGNDPAEAAARQKVIADAAARGERRGDLSKLSPEMLALLREFHNRLVAITA